MKIKMDDIIAIERPNNVKHHIEPYSKPFKISWKMTDWCNYRCEYCYMSNAVKRGKHTPEDTVLKVASNLDKIITAQANDRYITLHLIGGEVCYYNLIKVLSEIKSQNLFRVVIATNFSQSIDYWNQLISYFNNRKFIVSRTPKLQIISSFHLTQCNPDEFVNKAIQLKTKVKCVVNDNNLPSYLPYLSKLLSAGNTVQVTVERDNMNCCSNSIKNPKSKAYIEYLNKDLSRKDKVYYIVTLRDGTKINFYSNIELINSIDIGGLAPEGFRCTAGIDGVRVTPKGDLQRAGCRYCASKFGIGKIGNIFDENIIEKLPKSDFVCHCMTLPSELLDEGGNKTGLPDYNNLQPKMCTAFINANMYRDGYEYK
jgi:MoaA/NifB/PqqE/SkfB family radical SAM enzyme